MLHLTIMQNFRSIGNHLDLNINKKKHVWDMLPLNHGGENVLFCGPALLYTN